MTKVVCYRKSNGFHALNVNVCMTKVEFDLPHCYKIRISKAAVKFLFLDKFGKVKVQTFSLIHDHLESCSVPVISKTSYERFLVFTVCIPIPE